MTNEEIIDVLVAHSKGKAIEYKKKNSDDPWETIGNPTWDFERYDYRRELLEFWINIYPCSIQRIAHTTRKLADTHAEPNRSRCIKVREIPDDK